MARPAPLGTIWVNCHIRAADGRTFVTSDTPKGIREVMQEHDLQECWVTHAWSRTPEHITTPPAGGTTRQELAAKLAAGWVDPYTT